MPKPATEYSAEFFMDLGYAYVRQLPDGSWAGVKPMLFGNARLCMDMDWSGVNGEQYCYDGLAAAVLALASFDPDTQEEPQGWKKSVLDGRRRPGGDASKEYIDA